jgi:hypothetical protein
VALSLALGLALGRTLAGTLAPMLDGKLAAASLNKATEGIASQIAAPCGTAGGLLLTFFAMLLVALLTGSRSPKGFGAPGLGVSSTLPTRSCGTCGKGGQLSWGPA